LVYDVEVRSPEELAGFVVERFSNLCGRLVVRLLKSMGIQEAHLAVF
jgi:hypothetical protein